MDLQIKLEDTILKIRVAGLVRTSNGYIFEKNAEKGYVFPIGGKIMLNESSEEAVKREIMEEIGMQVKNVKLKSIIENFYGSDDNKVQEICFVYEVVDEFIGVLPKEFIEIDLGSINNHDIRPATIKNTLLNSNSFDHFVIR